MRNKRRSRSRAKILIASDFSTDDSMHQLVARLDVDARSGFGHELRLALARSGPAINRMTPIGPDSSVNALLSRVDTSGVFVCAKTSPGILRLRCAGPASFADSNKGMTVIMHGVDREAMHYNSKTYSRLRSFMNNTPFAIVGVL